MRITSGKYAEAVGSVVEVREQTGAVRVLIEGVHGGVPIKAEPWLKIAQLEVVAHG